VWLATTRPNSLAGLFSAIHLCCRLALHPQIHPPARPQARLLVHRQSALHHPRQVFLPRHHFAGKSDMEIMWLSILKSNAC